MVRQHAHKPVIAEAYTDSMADNTCYKEGLGKSLQKTNPKEPSCLSRQSSLILVACNSSMPGEGLKQHTRSVLGTDATARLTTREDAAKAACNAGLSSTLKSLRAQ
jgi:hypothetical protein